MESSVPGVRASARRVIFSISAASALLGAAPGAVLADLVGVDPVAEEAARAVVGTADGVETLVTGAIASGSSGARSYFKDRSPRKLSVQKAEDLTLQRNLDIKVQRLRVRQAEQSVVGTEAALDPNLAYAINVDVSKNYERTDTFIRLHEKVVDFDKLDEDFQTVAGGGVPASPEPCVIVDGKVINDKNSLPPGDPGACDAVDEISPIQDFASFKTDTLPIWNFSFSPSKNLRPGGQVVVDLNTEYKKRLGTSIGFFDNPVSVDDPLGNGSRYAWASSIKFIAALPFPYMRNFGEHGNPITVSIALAKEALEAQKWAYASTTNERRARAQSLYWSIVNTVLQLRTNIRHRETLGKLYESAKRLFDQRQITKYDLLQADTDLQRANAREEAAWGEYLKASNALVELLDLGRGVYIVPAGFVHDLQQSYEVDIARALETAYKNRPELRAAESAVSSSNINFRFRKIDTRPNVTLNVSYDLQQDNSILGYRDPIDSLLNLVRPDKDNFFIGLTYNYPFGNVTVKKELSRARIARSQAMDDRERTRVGITQDVNSAVANVLSAQTRIRLTKTNLKLAELSYQRGKRLQENARATQFELLSVFDSLLDARVEHIKAITAYQAASADLERAQGLLVDRYKPGAEQ